MFSTFKNELIRPGIDSKGYYYAALATEQGPKNMRIHRLVMMSFCYFPGCENTIINHCNGIKTQCDVWNLEWSTYSENAIHAYQTGLNGRFSSKRIISNEDVIQISNLLMENKYSCTDIAIMFNISVDLVYSIKFKKAYTDLTSSYIFPDTKQIYDDLYIEKICYVMSTNKPYKPLYEMNKNEKHNYYQIIIQKAEMDNSARSVDLIKRLYRRQSFTNISNKYTF